MKLVIFLTITLVLIISFFIKKKPLHIFENIFLILVLEFIFTGYIGVLQINLGYWKVTDGAGFLVIFRIWEIIITPVLLLWFFNMMENKQGVASKIWTTFVFIVLLYFFQFLLLKWKMITANGWEVWQSMLVIVGIVVITYFLLVMFRGVLRKEGLKK